MSVATVISNREKLVQKLRTISEEAQRISAADYADLGRIRADIVKLVFLVRDLETFARSLQDLNGLELQALATHEREKLEKISMGLFELLQSGKAVGELVFPIVISLAGGIKYYNSITSQSASPPIAAAVPANMPDSMNIAPPPPISRSATMTSTISKSSTLTDEKSITLKSINTNSNSNNRSPITLDMMIFAKSCSRALNYLKQPTVERKVVLELIGTVLSSVKTLISDETFTSIVDKEKMTGFIDIVKELRRIDDDVLTDSDVATRLKETLGPIASSVKKAAFDMQNVDQDDNHIPMTVATTRFEYQPLGLHHDAFGMPLTKTDTTDSFETLPNANSYRNSMLHPPKTPIDSYVVRSPLRSSTTDEMTTSLESKRLSYNPPSDILKTRHLEPPSSYQNHNTPMFGPQLTSIKEQSISSAKAKSYDSIPAPATLNRRKSSALYKNANESNPGSSNSSMNSLSSESAAPEKSSKGLFKGSSILGFSKSGPLLRDDKKSKGDTIKRFFGGGSNANSKSNLLTSQSRKRFEDYCKKKMNVVGFGFADDDTVFFKGPETDADELTVKCVNGDPRVESGTLERIMNEVIDEFSNDQELLKCYITTYRHHMKAIELLQNLANRYKNALVNPSHDQTPEGTQMQIAAFLCKWVEIAYSDFEKDQVLSNALDSFITLIKNTKNISLMAEQIRIAMDKQKIILANERQIIESAAPSKAIVTNIGREEFVKLDPLELARQLTRIDFELLSQIRSVSYAEYLWEKNSQQVAMDAWVNRFNLVSYWVGTEICTTPLPKPRIAVVENIIKLLRHLRDLNNYNGVMAVIAGLNTSSVRRLQKTWAGLGFRTISTLHEIESTMDPKMNYQTYRELENKLRASNQPFVPFMGLYLKDLTFSNDGNPKLLQNGLVNFSKNWAIYDLISKIDKCKDVRYTDLPANTPQSEKLYEYCKQLIALPEKRLYSYSLLCEPRAKKEDAKDTDSAVRLIEKWAQHN